MASLKELRTRINSIRSTQKITSAMKMVAASRLRKAQMLVTDSTVYTKNVMDTAIRLVYALQQEEKQNNTRYMYPNLMRKPYKRENYMLVVFSSDRGLCGSFNYQVAKVAIERIEQLQKEMINVKVICVGKKAADLIKRTHAENVVEVREGMAKKGADYREMKNFGFKLLNRFNSREFDVCEIITSKFISAINREVKPVQFLPLVISKDLGHELDYDPTMLPDGAQYEYEADKMTMLEEALPLLFRGLIFQAMVHSQASEQSARMTSMDNATRNAMDMIKKLTLKYNGIRQTAITTELVEIIAGAEAV